MFSRPIDCERPRQILFLDPTPRATETSRGCPELREENWHSPRCRVQRCTRRAHSDRAEAKAPIVSALRGKEFIEYDNPYDVGLTGLLGFSSGYHAIMGSDVFLMLGTDFPYRQFYPEKSTVIQVDIRGEQIGRRTRRSRIDRRH